MTTGFSKVSSLCYQIASVYTESIQKLNICTINDAVTPGFSFFFKSPFAPENIKHIFLHYHFCYTISIERCNPKCLPVLHKLNFPAYAANRNQNTHSWKSALKALQQFNQSMCILSELSATKIVAYSQQWLQFSSKQTTESKKVFSY